MKTRRDYLYTWLAKYLILLYTIFGWIYFSKYIDCRSLYKLVDFFTIISIIAVR